jgi:hypothetical protein
MNPLLGEGRSVQAAGDTVLFVKGCENSFSEEKGQADSLNQAQPSLPCRSPEHFAALSA